MNNYELQFNLLMTGKRRFDLPFIFLLKHKDNDVYWSIRWPCRSKAIKLSEKEVEELFFSLSLLDNNYQVIKIAVSDNPNTPTLGKLELTIHLHENKTVDKRRVLYLANKWRSFLCNNWFFCCCLLPRHLCVSSVWQETSSSLMVRRLNANFSRATGQQFNRTLLKHVKND